MVKKVLFIDMDGVLVDIGYSIDQWIESHPELSEMYLNKIDYIPGIFRDPPPIVGAIESIQKLYASNKYDMFIATTAPWGNPDAATDKRYWLEKHFGNLFERKMFITHRKDMLRGDILIDDRLKNGAGEFPGEFIHFGWDYENKKWNEYPTWKSVIKKLL